MFFVRQKCIPNILAQCYLLRIDETIEAPVLETGAGSQKSKNYFTECFIGNDGILRHDYTSRLYQYKHKNDDDMDKSLSSYAFAGICPDFSLN
jgi:hypothetical protein